MKKCSRCRKNKKPSSFFKNRSRKDGLNGFCKECQRKYQRVWYKNNKNKHKKATFQRKEKYALRAQQQIISYLREHPCVDCGIDNIVVLEFDHIKGKKKYNISTMVRRGMSENTITKELEKCVSRCANCHRLKTAKNRGYYKYKALVA